MAPPTEQATDAQKLAQLIWKCKIKAIEMVINSRITPYLPSMPRLKTNTWFNIECAELPDVRTQLTPWLQHLSTPLQLQIFIDSTASPLIREAVSAQSHEPSLVLLESWLLRYEPSGAKPEGIQWAGFFKRFLVLFRALAAYLRLMPAHRFAASLAKLRAAPVLGYRISLFSDSQLGFPESPPHKAFEFAPPDMHHGKMYISVAYRAESQYSPYTAPQPTSVCCGPPLAGQLIQDYVPFDPGRYSSRGAGDPRNAQSTSQAASSSRHAQMSPQQAPRTAPHCAATSGRASTALPTQQTAYGAAHACRAPAHAPVNIGANADAAGYCSARSSGGRSFEGVRSSPPIQMPEPTSRTREVWATSVQHTPIGSPELSGGSSCNAEVAAALARAGQSPGTPFTPSRTRLTRCHSPTLPEAAQHENAQHSTQASASAATSAANAAANTANAPSASSFAAAAAAAAERVRFNSRADELPFVFEEEIQEPTKRVDAEAALGSFIDEVQQAPSLQLFSSSRRASGSGAVSPLLARSVEDFSSQLDLLRSRFVETSLGGASTTAEQAGEKLRQLAASPLGSPSLHPVSSSRLSPTLDGAMPSALHGYARPTVVSASSRASSANCSLSGSPQEHQRVHLGTPPMAIGVGSKAQAPPQPGPATVRPCSAVAAASDQRAACCADALPADADSTEALLARSPPPDDSLFPLAMPPPR
uniref:Autophagy-related protein 13 N-terminal domain-containing protein n=1 Tax=Chrysotila carterae TaxID=13221 RepID=A0A7S4BF18_CHRCT